MKNKTKVPLRMCVVCREMKPQKELVRIVLTQQGYEVDLTGKKNGRGAYLCRSLSCFQNAVKSRGLERSFKQEIPQEVYDRLEKEMGEIEKEG